MRKVMLVAWTLSIAGIMVLSIGLVHLDLRPARAVQAAQSDALPGPPTAPEGSGRFLPILRVFLLAGTAIILVVIIVSAFSKAGRKRLLIVAGTFLLLLIVQTILSLVLPPLRKGEQAAPPTMRGELPPPAFSPSAVVVPLEPQPPRWLLFTVAAVSVLLAAAGVAGVLAFVRKRRPRGARMKLAESSRAAADSLGRGAELRNVILRCYHEMSVIIRDELGLDRESSVTPREFAALLEGWGLPAEPVRDLTDAFEEIRYGNAALSPQSEQRALRSLSSIARFCRETP